MVKTRESNMKYILLLILFQSLLAISIGIAVLLSMSTNKVPPDIYAGDIDIGGMTYKEAADKIETVYAGKLEQDSIKLDDGSGKTYKIPFSVVKARIDGNATVAKLKISDGLMAVPELFNIYFRHTGQIIEPVMKFDEGKLRLALLDLSEKIYEAPKDAIISYKNGIIEKRAETIGISLNVSKAVEVIRKQLSSSLSGVVKLDRHGAYELEKVEPSVMLKDYEDINLIISEYTTPIIHKELESSIRIAAESINGLIVQPDIESGAPISFVESLKLKNASFDNDNEGYDQVASTLYAALLMAGISKDSITRSPHKLAVDYIEPGLDAWISGNACDLKFSNPLRHKIAIFAQIENDKVKIVIGGNEEDKKGDYELKSEVIQKFLPPVLNVENIGLKPGTEIILNPGKEGILVNVYRNDELIGTDKYEAEKRIIQTGPDTGHISSDK